MAPRDRVFVIRPRLVMLDDELVVVGVFVTKRYPLRGIVGADPTGFGAHFSLVDGDMFCASTIARPNYAWERRRPPTRFPRSAAHLYAIRDSNPEPAV